VAYLDSLGHDAIIDRWAANQLWQPQGNALPPPLNEQRRLFIQWCAVCHGDAGRGDGPAAASLAIKPRDLVEDNWRYVPAGGDAVAERLALARVIKFGLPATVMAGREYLNDDTILSLVAYLQTLHAKK
jgi:cytochrome c oxidase cbb3-type subunit 2